jgi:transcriptional repressor NrdR
MVVKRSGRREPFDRTKIEKGIERALEKRPVSQMNIELLVNEIEDSAAIMGKADHELTSSAIGELVLDKLAILDKAAYIRFASVYKRFESVEEFIAEIKRMKPPEEAGREAAGGC